jgi:hypothetical protein
MALAATSCDWISGGTDAASSGGGLTGYPGQNADATKSYLASLDFSVQDSVFDGWMDCEVPGDCGNSDSVHIRVVPESRAHKAPIATAMGGGKGYIVARVQNLENKPFAPYGMAANDTAYLWVGSTQSNGMKFALYRIASGTGQATILAIAPQAGKCGAPDPDRKIPAVHINPVPMCSDSMIYSGESSAARNMKPVQLASLSSHLPAGMMSTVMFSHSRGMWFSCSMGCCEARGFQSLQD